LGSTYPCIKEVFGKRPRGRGQWILDNLTGMLEMMNVGSCGSVLSSSRISFVRFSLSYFNEKYQ